MTRDDAIEIYRRALRATNSERALVIFAIANTPGAYTIDVVEEIADLMRRDWRTEECN